MTTCDVCNVEFEIYDDDNCCDNGYYESYCGQCCVLLRMAKQALSTARRVGVPLYGPSSWRDVSVQGHKDHALSHIVNTFDTDEDHLAHAICRLVMAKALSDG